jgi:excisionase family DNA binding protein
LETIEAGSDAYAIACEEELYRIREVVSLGHPLLNLSGLSRTYVPAVAPKPRILEIQNITLRNETTLEIDSSQDVDIVDVPNADSAFDMPQGENWLTTEEIAKDLKVNVNTVRRWIQSGELVALDVGGEYRISREDYEDFIQRRKTDRQKQ